MNEDLKLKGSLTIQHFNKNNELVEELRFHNLIVNVGKAQIASLIGGLGANPFTYVAVGTGTTAAAATDTALETEVARVQTTNSLTTTSVTNDTAHFEGTIDFTSSYAITEYGLFDASTGGNMLNRAVKSAINVSNGDSIKVLWDVQTQ